MAVYRITNCGEYKKYMDEKMAIAKKVNFMTNSYNT